MTPNLRASLDAIGRAVSAATLADLPEIVGELERLKATAWMRAAGHTTDRADTATCEQNLSAQEAARRLGVSVAWLYKNARRLPFALRIGRRLLFSASGLERWNRQRQGVRIT